LIFKDFSVVLLKEKVQVHAGIFFRTVQWQAESMVYNFIFISNYVAMMVLLELPSILKIGRSI
jgi:hypothetical protein